MERGLFMPLRAVFPMQKERAGCVLFCFFALNVWLFIQDYLPLYCKVYVK